MTFLGYIQYKVSDKFDKNQAEENADNFEEYLDFQPILLNQVCNFFLLK